MVGESEKVASSPQASRGRRGASTVEWSILVTLILAVGVVTILHLGKTIGYSTYMAGCTMNVSGTSLAFGGGTETSTAGVGFMDPVVMCHIQAELSGYAGVAPMPSPAPIPNASGPAGEE